MAEGQKRYYWLKLQNDFFSRKEIKRLRRIAGGDTLTIIYLKMLCRSLKDNGRLYYDGLDNDFVSELAMDIDEDTENVQITVNYLIKTGLLEQIDEVEYTLKDAESNTGTETAVAARVRKHRERRKALQCNTDVTAAKQLGYVEIEKDKEIEEEKEKKEEHPSSSEILKMYGDNIHPVSSLVEAEKLKALVDTHGETFVAKAIERAVMRNKRSLAYITGILNNWEANGYDEGVEGKRTEKQSDPERSADLERFMREREEHKKKQRRF
jgi:phage replisome organizer N-terminal domain protein|nr:MAG TPA: replisome organizer protein [Caudoviricetes sp.]